MLTLMLSDFVWPKLYCKKGIIGITEPKYSDQLSQNIDNTPDLVYDVTINQKRSRVLIGRIRKSC